MNWRAFLDAWKQRERVSQLERRVEALERLPPKVAELDDKFEHAMEQTRSVVRSVVNQYRQDDR